MTVGCCITTRWTRGTNSKCSDAPWSVLVWGVNTKPAARGRPTIPLSSSRSKQGGSEEMAVAQHWECQVPTSRGRGSGFCNPPNEGVPKIERALGFDSYLADLQRGTCPFKQPQSGFPQKTQARTFHDLDRLTLNCPGKCKILGGVDKLSAPWSEGEGTLEMATARTLKRQCRVQALLRLEAGHAKSRAANGKVWGGKRNNN